MQLSEDLISDARSHGCTKAILMFQDMILNNDTPAAEEGCQDLQMILHCGTAEKANPNTDEIGFRYYNKMMAWLFFETGKEELEKLFLIAADDGDLNIFAPDVAVRIDRLDRAYENAREQNLVVSDMHAIQKLALGNGADYVEISGDYDLEKSYAHCKARVDNMTPYELGIYQHAIDAQLEVVGPDDASMDL